MSPYAKFKTLVLSLMLIACVCSYGRDPYKLYQRETFVTQHGDTLPYRLLKPEAMNPDEKYPLVLFLHGSGERGNDNKSQLTHGGQMWLNPYNREQYPAYVLVPQCPDGLYWGYDSRPESLQPAEMPIPREPAVISRLVMRLLQDIVSENQVDPDRIYVIGLSMGGMGTYDIACFYPETFAAAVPICGSVNPIRLASAKDVKFRIYHGDNDQVVPVDGSREAYKALKDAGAEVVYIEFPGVTHGSWNPAFNDPQFLPWLFAQSKAK